MKKVGRELDFRLHKMLAKGTEQKHKTGIENILIMTYKQKSHAVPVNRIMQNIQWLQTGQKEEKYLYN